MARYQNQPYITGDTEPLKLMFSNAGKSLVRVGIFGDSRTDPDQSSVADHLLESRLNFNAFRRFGQASETPIARCGTTSRSTTIDPTFCVPAAFNYGTKLTNSFAATAADFYDLPPGFSTYRMNTANNLRGVSIGLDPECTGLNSSFGDFVHSGLGPFFPTSNVRLEAFFRRDTNCAAAQINFVDVASNSSATPSVGVTDFTQNDVVTFDLTEADGGLKKFTSDIHNPPAAGKYINAVLAPMNSGVIYTGADGPQIAGARFVQDGISKGVVFQSFGAGNYDADEVLTRHPNMGQAINTMGPYRVWMIILGANDYGSPSYASPTTNFGSKIQAIIDAVRSSDYGGDASTSIVLCNPYARTSAQSTFDVFTEQLIELSHQNENTVFLNIARKIEDLGYSPTATKFTSDGVHFNTRSGATIYADALFDMLTSATRGGQYYNDNQTTYSLQSVSPTGQRRITAEVF